MKTPFRLLALAAALALSACAKTPDPSPAPAALAAAEVPLLGRWQADTLRQVNYDAAGQVKSDEVHLVRAQFEFTAATLTFSSGGQSQPWTYARAGEVLTLSGAAAPEQCWARRVRPGYFTFEAYSRAGIPVGSAGAARLYYSCHR